MPWIIGISHFFHGAKSERNRYSKSTGCISNKFGGIIVEGIFDVGSRWFDCRNPRFVVTIGVLAGKFCVQNRYADLDVCDSCLDGNYNCGLTVGSQAFRAALANPVESLRAE